MKQIIVVAAIIENNNNEFLIVQRNNNSMQGNLWEFPGGKIEFGETPHEALIREIDEELSIQIFDLELFDISWGMLNNDLQAIMILYNCKSKNNNITLNVGKDFKWVKKTELHNYQFTLLDIEPTKKLLRK